MRKAKRRKKSSTGSKKRLKKELHNTKQKHLYEIANIYVIIRKNNRKLYRKDTELTLNQKMRLELVYYLSIDKLYTTMHIEKLYETKFLECQDMHKKISILIYAWQIPQRNII